MAQTDQDIGALLSQPSPATLGVQPTKSFDLQTDANGGWDLNFLNDLSPGLHTVEITADDGEVKELNIYVAKDNTPTMAITEKVQFVIPSFLYIIIAVCALVVLVLGIYDIILARSLDLHERLQKRRHHMRRAMIFSTVLIFLSLAGSLIANWNADWVRSMRKAFIRQAPATLVTASGVLMDPATMNTVKGVDMVSGNTAIHTSQSGYFIFANVDQLGYITITSPDLKRRLLKTVENSSRMTVYFNADMYNLLAKISELEARKNYTEIYNNLPDEIKQKVSAEVFALNYQPLFGHDSLMDQEITIGKTDMLTDTEANGYGVRIPKAVQVDVIKGTSKNSYYFVWENEQWRVYK